MGLDILTLVRSIKARKASNLRHIAKGLGAEELKKNCTQQLKEKGMSKTKHNLNGYNSRITVDMHE